MNIDSIRDRLQRRRTELQARSERIGVDLRGEAGPAHAGFVDQAVAHANDPVLEGIRESAEQELQQIDRALGRLAAGRYEECEVCGRSIARDRLAATPYANTCIDCSS